MSCACGEYPPFTEREIAILRGWAAENHRRIHLVKNETQDRGQRDARSEEMREIEVLSGKLARLL